MRAGAAAAAARLIDRLDDGHDAPVFKGNENNNQTVLHTLTCQMAIFNGCLYLDQQLCQRGEKMSQFNISIQKVRSGHDIISLSASTKLAIFNCACKKGLKGEEQLTFYLTLQHKIVKKQQNFTHYHVIN